MKRSSRSVQLFKISFRLANYLNINFLSMKTLTTFLLLSISLSIVAQNSNSNPYPCENDPKYRHFDFWLGEWDVFVNGNKVGDNSITKAVGGCAIHESYTTQQGYAGQSINFYDPIDKKWHQHWVGSGQDVYNYLEVDKSEGMLQFESPFWNPQNGQVSISRLTFTLNEDGSVRQLFQTSTDEGKTWTAGFDGLYKK